MKTTFKIILDAKSKDEKRKMFLAVTANGQTRQYSLGLDYLLTKDEWSNDRLKITKEAKAKAAPFLEKARKIINELGEGFTFDIFKLNFKGQESSDKTHSMFVEDVLNVYFESKQLTAETKESYKTAVNQLLLFKNKVKVTDFTVDLLQRFMKHLAIQTTRNGMILSDATIGIYMRSLKALYNFAEKQYNMEPSKNPFGKNKIQMPTKTTKNIALSHDDFLKLVKYVPTDKSEMFAKDFFLLSFILGGMNIADIIGLKNNNINDDMTLVEYVRTKTKNRIKDPNKRVIRIALSESARKIMNLYGSLDLTSPNDYIFPFIKDGMSDRQLLIKRRTITKQVNSGLQSICNKLGIRKVTSYSARHTFATLLTNNGQPVETLSRYMGHTEIHTTQAFYIDYISNKNIKTIGNIVEGLVCINKQKDDETSLSMMEAPNL